MGMRTRPALNLTTSFALIIKKTSAMKTTNSPAQIQSSTDGAQTWSAGTVVQLGVFVFALSLLFFSWTHPQFGSLAVAFVSIVLEAFPFMLVGSLVSGFIEAFISKDRIASLVPRQRLYAVFAAAALGIVLPVCECAIVPVVRRLAKKGVPLSAVVAFLLGGPIVNPIVFASTAAAYGFDWNVPIMRTVFGYMVAVVVAIIMSVLLDRHNAPLRVHNLEGPLVHDVDGCHCHVGHSRKELRVVCAVSHAADDFMEVAGFLVMGAFAAALIQNAVDRSAFLLLGNHPSLSIIVMMGLAAIMNLCSEADAFVAASFRLFVPMSGQMAFMVLGPMLDVKLIFMYSTLFRKRAILTLTSLILIAVYAVIQLHGVLGSVIE